LFLWYWDRTRESRTIKQWILLGVIAGLMIGVYRFPGTGEQSREGEDVRYGPTVRAIELCVGNSGETLR
jgi:hypothetical protein